MVNTNKDTSTSNYMQELIKASGRGLDNLTRTLADLLELHVLITTPAYELISTTLIHPELDLFHVKIEGEREDRESLFFCTITSENLQKRGVGRAIAPSGRVIGYAFVLFDKAELDLESYQSIIESAASLYATHLQNQLDLKQERHKTKNDFFYDLLYGNFKRSEEIVRKGEVWGWDFRQPHTVLLLIIPDLELHSPDWHLMDFLQKTVDRTLINKYFKNPATTVRRNELITLLPLEENKPAKKKQEISALINDILGQFLTTELNNRVVCGVGQTYVDPNNLFRSYQEAKVAYEMGSLLRVEVPFFSDMGLERILYKHDLQDLKEYYDHVLGELHKQDEAEDGLFELLESFADNQFDVNKTAQDTFLHRNTLRYRINKIEMILGRSLADVNTRLDIVAAFKIRRLHRLEQEFSDS